MTQNHLDQLIFYQGLDMCISEQQTQFVEQIGVIPRSVHGFRQGHGTITASIQMQTHVHTLIQKENLVSVCPPERECGI